MLHEELKSKLSQKLVDVTIILQQIRDDKKTQIGAISDLIKNLEKRQKAISRAIKNDDEDELINTFGKFYVNELGLKCNQIDVIE